MFFATPCPLHKFTLLYGWLRKVHPIPYLFEDARLLELLLVATQCAVDGFAFFNFDDNHAFTFFLKKFPEPQRYVFGVGMQKFFRLPEIFLLSGQLPFGHRVIAGRLRGPSGSLRGLHQAALPLLHSRFFSFLLYVLGFMKSELPSPQLHRLFSFSIQYNAAVPLFFLRDFDLLWQLVEFGSRTLMRQRSLFTGRLFSYDFSCLAVTVLVRDDIHVHTWCSISKVELLAELLIFGQKLSGHVID